MTVIGKSVEIALQESRIGKKRLAVESIFIRLSSSVNDSLQIFL